MTVVGRWERIGLVALNLPFWRCVFCFSVIATAPDELPKACQVCDLRDARELES